MKALIAAIGWLASGLVLAACSKQGETPPAKPADTAPQSEYSIPAPPAPAVTAAEPDKGKTVYDATCAACHGAGVAGAPRLGDKTAWQARIAQGNALLEEHAIKGFQGKTGFMPARGGNAALSDDDIKAAVVYMVQRSK